MNTIRTKEGLTNDLQDKDIRDFYVAEHINIGIPLQVRALRKQRGWTQEKLAKLTGMKQERISAIENPNYKHKFTLSIMMKIASAFDVALIVRFAPISELVKWELALSPERLEAVGFDKDPYFKPPEINVVGSARMEMGGAGIIELYNTRQPPKHGITVLAEYKADRKMMKESQKELENQVQQIMTETEVQQQEGIR